MAKECAAIDGTYSSGNCCRFTRHSHLITRGLARPFVNHCGAKLGNKFVSLPSLTKNLSKDYETRIRISGSGCPSSRYGQRPLRQRTRSEGAVRESQRDSRFPHHGHHVRRYGRGAEADEGNAACRIPPLGNHGQGARRETRCGRRTLAGRILGAGRRRSALVRRRPETRIETCSGHAGRLRGTARHDGRHPRSGRQDRRGYLRVDRRRGRGCQLQLPRTARHLRPAAHCVCPWAERSTRR